MKNKDFDHIDKLAQDAFEHFEVPFDAGDWMDFQQQLNKESTIDQVAKDTLQAYEVPLDPNGWEEFQQVQQRKKSGLLYIWWYKAAEAGIMALLLLGTLFNLPCSNKKSIHNNDGQPPWKFMGPRVKPYEIDWSIDVHTEEDLVKSEKWVRANLQITT